MTTLEEAWKWYQGVKTSLRRFAHLADKFWDELPWDGRLDRDNTFRVLDRTTVSDDARTGLSELDDFAVFVLFSVFEAVVRERVLSDTKSAREAVTHPALKYWMSQAEESIRERSFFALLESFKAPHRNDLIEGVNQVRKYRNWVAHGRQGRKEESVTPQTAYERLREFLNALPPPA
jgi:hypothetical protein